jgi:hypothetical protein
MIKLVKTNLHAALKYHPKNDANFTPVVTCFNTTESIRECDIADLGWSDQTGGNVVVNKIKGNHNDILFNNDTVKALADYILKHYQVRRSDKIQEFRNIIPTVKRYHTELQSLGLWEDIEVDTSNANTL